MDNKQLKVVPRRALESIRPYTPGKPIEDVKRELGIDDVIKMASNENPLGPSPKALEAMARAVGSVNFYPDGNCFEIKKAICALNGVEPDQVIVGNGSDEVIKLLAEAFINEGDRGIMADPSFSEYDFALTLMGGETVRVPLDGDFRHDLTAMAEAIDERTKMVFLCNPNNPTGTIVGQREVDAFLDRVPDHVVVVFDEAYHEYVQSDDYPRGLQYVKEGRANVIVLRTFSKIYGLSGLRVGYGVGHPELIGWLYRAREPFNVNSIAQAGARAGLGDDEHVRASVQINEAGKVYLYGELDRLGLSYTPTEANFIWLDTGRPCVPLFEALMQKGVIVRTGNVFGYDSWIRVTVGTPDQNERFIQALEEVLAG